MPDIDDEQRQQLLTWMTKMFTHVDCGAITQQGLFCSHLVKELYAKWSSWFINVEIIFSDYVTSLDEEMQVYHIEYEHVNESLRPDNVSAAVRDVANKINEPALRADFYINCDVLQFKDHLGTCYLDHEWCCNCVRNHTEIDTRKNEHESAPPKVDVTDALCIPPPLSANHGQAASLLVRELEATPSRKRVPAAIEWRPSAKRQRHQDNHTDAADANTTGLQPTQLSATIASSAAFDPEPYVVSSCTDGSANTSRAPLDAANATETAHRNAVYTRTASNSQCERPNAGQDDAAVAPVAPVVECAQKSTALPKKLVSRANTRAKKARTPSSKSVIPVTSIASPNQTQEDLEKENIEGLLDRFKKENRWSRLFRNAKKRGFPSFSKQEYKEWSASKTYQTTDLTEYDGWKPKSRGRFNLMEKNPDNNKQFRIRTCVIQAYQLTHGA
jgi:hypothetical protein